MATLADVVGALDRRYDRAWAQSWDSVGLVCGDPETPVTKVHFAIDPVGPVAEEAIAAGAQLLVCHHPLFLGGTDSVAATTPKGRLVHRLISSGVGLYVAHTNADVANPGVNDALAAAVGLADLQVLQPLAAGYLDKIVTFVPVDDAERVLDAMAAAGAGAVGEYSRCGYFGVGVGTFTPGAGTSPTIGTQGQVEHVKESRLETIAPRRARAAVIAALVAAHPYEEPAYDVVELAAAPSTLGLGRVGVLAAATTLAGFTASVAASLPRTSWGVRAAGDPDRPVRSVAVCGGSGDAFLADARRAGVDAYLTADLRHHVASEYLAEGGPALLDAAHWATERPWLDRVAAQLSADLGIPGTASDLDTDPWTLQVASSQLPQLAKEPRS